MPGTGPLGHEAVTVGATAVGITEVQGGMACMAATITVETDRIRYRVDGTAPTSTTGHEVGAGGVINLNDRMECKNFLAIRSSAAVGDATIRATMFSWWTP